MSTPEKQNTVPGYDPFGETELSQAEGFMYSDKPLTPKMISSLMHVQASLESTYMHEANAQKDTTYSLLYAFGIIVVSLAIAALIGTAFLYAHEIGPFSETNTARAS
jgi:hypothetical protein